MKNIQSLLISGMMCLLASACASLSQHGKLPSASFSAVQYKDDLVLASLNKESITLGSIRKHTEDPLRELQNDYEQRRLHLLWWGTEQETEKRLLEAEAKNEKTTVEKLLDENVYKKLSIPNEEKIKDFYENNKGSIPVSYEKAREQIKEQLQSEEREQSKAKYVQTLRDKMPLAYSLPFPADLPRQDLKPNDEPSKGPKNAPVTLILYSDFECPYCKQAQQVVDELAAQYGPSLRVLFRHFPLPQHPNATRAAEASLCAHEQGAFWKYHDALFSAKERLENDMLLKYAENIKLDSAVFKKCLSSDRGQKVIQRDIASAQKMGIQGTPAIFINGIRLLGLLPKPVIQAIVEQEKKSKLL